MAVKLRGVHEGYYAKEVTINGTKFWLTDLDDAQFERFLEDCAEAGKIAGVTDLVGTEPFDPGELMGQVMRLVGDPDKQRLARTKMQEVIASLLEVGLVDWDIAGDDGAAIECTQDMKRVLPAEVKSELAREIVAISQLTLGEAGFPGAAELGTPAG